MKKRFITAGVAVLLALAMSSLLAVAQDQEGRGREGRRMGRDRGDRAQRLAQQLNLTDDQKSQLQSILKDQQKEMQALRQDESLSREQRMERMREIQQSGSSKIKSILDADQLKKFEEMEKRREKMREERGPGRRGGSGGQRNNF